MVLAGDALRPPLAERLGGAADLVLLDPPYGEDLGAKALTALAAAGWLGPGCLVALEMGPRDQVPTLPGLTLFDQRRFGKARFVLFHQQTT